MTSRAHPDILSRADAGEHPDAIASGLGLSLSCVYTVLRKERPNRARKPRACTSDTPRIVRALVASGIEARRVAELLGITRAYVSKIMQGAK